MDISKILDELKKERTRIEQAISALGNLGTKQGNGRRNRATTTRRRKRRLTPEGRKRLSEMMKKRWAERKRRAKAA